MIGIRSTPTGPNAHVDWPEFPDVAVPVASVVIDVHGRWDQTLECLRSVAASGDVAAFEIVVVDDGSLDDTAVNLACIRGVTIVETRAYVGTVRARNAGAKHARSDVLVFLSQDVHVESGWLDALLATLGGDETIGLVGSMVLEHDGLVKESGTIVWSDGSRRPLGRGSDRMTGAVRSVREVDACSGEALAVRRSVFEALGGFDDRFAPACYEDVDLCFGVRSCGLRVVVEPASVVRRVVAPPDAGVGLNRFHEVNRLAFVRKWRHDLSTHTAPETGDVWGAASRLSSGMVLIIERVLPTPDRDAGSRRMWAILEELAALNLSVYFAVGEHIAMQPYRGELERRGVTVLESGVEQQRFLEEAGPRLRAVILCRPGVAWAYLDDVYRLAPQATLVFDTVDLHGLRIHRQSAVEQDRYLANLGRLVWMKERAVMQAVDVTLVVSSVEQQIVGTLVPDVDVRVLSTIHRPVVTTPQLEGRRDLVFVGGYLHEPNVDAVRWAIQEIMPLVWKSAPDTTLRLLGSYLPKELSELNGQGIDALGWVPDLAPYYEAARVVIAPLRFGAGVKGKVGEAIEHGVPVVGTSIALEGMPLVHGIDVLCADEPGDFADAVVRLLTDDELWRAMAGHGQGILVEEFSPKRARDTLHGILNKPRAQRPIVDLADF